MAMTLRLDEERDQRVELLARTLSVSKHEAVLRAIDETAERYVHKAEVAYHSQQARQRLADVLRRLGE